MKAARKMGLVCVKMDLRNNAGIPDYLILMPRGKPLWVEFKAPRKTPTAIQTKFHLALRKLGYEVVTVDNIAWGTEHIRRTLAERTTTSAVESTRVPEKIYEDAGKSSMRDGMAGSGTRQNVVFTRSLQNASTCKDGAAHAGNSSIARVLSSVAERTSKVDGVQRTTHGRVTRFTKR